MAIKDTPAKQASLFLLDIRNFQWTKRASREMTLSPSAYGDGDGGGERGRAASRIRKNRAEESYFSESRLLKWPRKPFPVNLIQNRKIWKPFPGNLLEFRKNRRKMTLLPSTSRERKQEVIKRNTKTNEKSLQLVKKKNRTIDFLRSRIIQTI